VRIFLCACFRCALLCFCRVCVCVYVCVCVCVDLVKERKKESDNLLSVTLFRNATQSRTVSPTDALATFQDSFSRVN